MQEKTTSLLAILFAFLSRPCCVLPLLFSLLGIGGVTFTATLVAYRHVFLLLTIGLLAVSFYLNYLKARAHIVNRITFWISAAVALGFLAYAYF